MSAIGRSVPRADGAAKVRGAAVYGMDYAEPGMLEAKVLRSPVAAGRITRLDVSRALALPGVRAVVTHADAPRLGGWLIKDQPLLAGDAVRFVGEPIAAVAADTTAAAAAAVAAIDLDIAPGEPVTDPVRALAEGARLVHPDWRCYAVPAPAERGGNTAWEVRLRRGDVDAAFRAAHVVVEDEFRAPRQHQTPIEPHVAVARYAGGRFTIHTPAQFPFLVRDRVAEFLSVRPSAVRIVVPTIGGGFGGKLDAMLEPIAALLARSSGRPVRLANTRREEQATAYPREDAVVRLSSAVAADGAIVGMRGEAILDNGAYSGETPALTSIPGIVWGATYRVPTADFRGRAAYTNTTPTGAYRGVCAPYCVWALESHLDHIAERLGLDRRELRLRNLLRKGERTVNGQVLPDAGLEEGFARVEALAPWAAATARRRPLRGVGLAAVTWMTNDGPGSASVRLNEDGTVAVVSGAPDIGTGAMATGVRQIVAEELGVAHDDVLVTAPDTDAAGYDAGAQGSRTTFGAGNAALRAAEDVRRQVLDTAAGLLEASPEDLVLEAGGVAVSGAPDTRIPLGRIAQAALGTTGPIAASGRHTVPPLANDGGCMTPTVLTTFAATTSHVHLAEVEVDPDTGKVRIVRYVVAQDVGRAVNPRAIEGQIRGGVLQGVGYALFEDLRLEGGTVVDDGLETYRLPTALDAPPIEIAILEHPCPYGPFGVKGAAEPPIIPAPAAVANAVADAIGRRFARLPITPFDVLAALREGAGDAPTGARAATTGRA